MNSCKSTPDKHMIPYPARFGTRPLSEGASSFQGKLDHPDSRYYKFNDFYHMESDETLHILSRFETYQQTTEYTCGAASALMVLNHMGQKQYNEDILGSLMETAPFVGTSVENMADFFDVIGWNVYYHADTKAHWNSEKEFEMAVIALIDRGIPLIVDWLDWTGHWAVIIGIDTCSTEEPYDDVLIFADPYDITSHFQDGYTVFSLARFFGMWREGVCANKAEPYVQPFVAAFPKEFARLDPSWERLRFLK